jgi:pilus assembly protein CpaB
VLRLHQESESVAVAKVAIPIGTKIIPEQVTMVQFPKESTPDGTFASVKLTRRVPSNIAPREPITDSRPLAPEAQQGGLSAVIPEGFRADDRQG